MALLKPAIVAILAFAILIVPISADCTDTIPPTVPHFFYGNITINGQPAPDGTIILVTGPGVRSNITGNPITSQTEGSYGYLMAVQGCIAEGAPLIFYVDGEWAEVYDVGTSGPWQDTYPFITGGDTNLNLRVTLEPPIVIQGQVLPPTDPDNDFLYEDTNGNGRIDFNDVVIYFQNMEWIAQNEPVSYFDYNRNGRIDFNDVVLLFKAV